MITINATFKIRKEDLIDLEEWLKRNIDVVNFKIMPDTKKLYENDTHFKKLIKSKRDLNLEIDRYINDHNK